MKRFLTLLILSGTALAGEVFYPLVLSNNLALPTWATNFFTANAGYIPASGAATTIATNGGTGWGTTLISPYLSGDTIIDTGDELQDTVDYSLALTPNGNTPTENDASARPRSVATIASLISDADPLLVPTYARVSVLGYAAAGDGGGGDFRRVLASSGTNNAGTFFTSTFNATYAWERVPPDAYTPVMFGAKGDGVTDDTAAFQAWIDFIGSRIIDGNASLYPARIPDGTYIISSVTNRTAVPFVSTTGSAPKEFEMYRGTTLIHKSGATAPMIVVQIPTGDRGAPVFQGLALIGRPDTNLKAPKAVVSASTRTNFVVATTNLPPDPYAAGLTNSFSKVGNLVTGLAWPYFGFATLHTSEGKLLGSALIYSCDYGTGDVVIFPDWDRYETVVANGGLLGAGDQVSWSGISTEDSTFADDTGIEAGSSGYAAIHIESTENQTGGDVTIENCWFRWWHTGIRIGNVLRTRVQACRFDYMEFASIASAFPGDSRDGRMHDVFTYGGWRDNELSTPETISVTTSGGGYRNSYRNQLWAIYGLEQSGIYSGILVNNTVNGLFGNSVLETQMADTMLEALTGDGILLGPQSPTRIGLQISSLVFRSTQGDISDAATNRTRVGLRSLSSGSNLRVGISQMSMVDSSAGLNPFTDAFSLSSGDEVIVGNLAVTNGVAQIMSSGSTSPQVMAVAGYNGGWVSGPTTAATFGRFDVAASKALSFPSGRPVWLSTLGWSVDTDSIVDSANKNLRIGTLHYDTDEEPVVGLNVQGQASANYVNIGGGTGIGNAATQVSIYSAANNTTTTGTEVVRVTTSGLSVLTGNAAFAGAVLTLNSAEVPAVQTSAALTYSGGTNITVTVPTTGAPHVVNSLAVTNAAHITFSGSNVKATGEILLTVASGTNSLSFAGNVLKPAATTVPVSLTTGTWNLEWKQRSIGGTNFTVLNVLQYDTP